MDGIYVLRNDCTLMKLSEPDVDFPGSEVFTFCETVRRSQATKFKSKEEAEDAIRRYIKAGSHGGYKAIVIDFRPELGYEDGEVIGQESDGQLVFWDATRDQRYVSGETLEDYGIENLRPEEKARLNLPETPA